MGRPKNNPTAVTVKKAVAKKAPVKRVAKKAVAKKAVAKTTVKTVAAIAPAVAKAQISQGCSSR
jgi:hypothetical protein